MNPIGTSPASAQLPGSIAGTPPGPGGSPAAAPGGGGGNKAAAIAQLKAVFPLLHNVFNAFEPGSKEWSALSRALTALGPVVGKINEEDSLVPSAITQMAMAARGGPLKNAPPVGLAPASPPAGAQPQAA
jgi:hypothetical protein